MKRLKGICLGLAFLAGQAPAFGAIRAITLEQAQQLAAVGEAHGSASSSVKKEPHPKFPLVVNQQVVEEVNKTLADRGKRRTFREMLARLEGYREMIEAKLLRHRLPLELLAVPVVESEYRNLPSADETPQGAGLWMLISRTARYYGLKVRGENVDERLNEEKSTEAAAKYLAHLYQAFHNWPLVLAAYNRGEWYVKGRIAATGTRDAWKIAEEDGALSPYLTRTMAAAFLLKHPKLLD